MEIVVLAVGRLRPYYREAADDYKHRLARYVSVREVSIREAGRAPTVHVQRAKEADAFRQKLPSRHILVALSRQGDAWTSRDLAGHLERWLEQGKGLAFAIGGSSGLAPNFSAEAALRWSLGPLTLPHELARVVVYEQLYRAFTIVRGEKYHKGG
jgi:23S rRNA (pseudouridine1915-N3)-methyltransferase